MLHLLCPLNFWETANQLLCATEHGNCIVHSLNGNNHQPKKPLYDYCPQITHCIVKCFVDTEKQYHICLNMDHLLGSDERQTQDYIINYKAWSLSICSRPHPIPEMVCL